MPDKGTVLNGVVLVQDLHPITASYCMTKREIIDHVMVINTSARPEFLAAFSHESLQEYLDHLREVLAEEHEPALLEPALVGAVS